MSPFCGNVPSKEIGNLPESWIKIRDLNVYSNISYSFMMPDFLKFGSVWLLYEALCITRNARFCIWPVLRIKFLSAFAHAIMPHAKWGVLRLCNGNIFFTCLFENKARDTFLFISLIWNFQLRFSLNACQEIWSFSRHNHFLFWKVWCHLCLFYIVKGYVSYVLVAILSIWSCQHLIKVCLHTTTCRDR